MPNGPYPSRWLVPSGTPDTIDDADVFPFLAGRAFNTVKTPLWSGKTDVSVSGRSRARALWSYPVWRFGFAHGVLRDASAYQELQRLFNFFNAHSGTGEFWFYLDRSDNAVTTNTFGTGDGVTTTFQLTRTTTYGNVTFTEPVRGLYGTPTIFDNGSPVSVAAFASGSINLATNPTAGNTVTINGQAVTFVASGAVGFQVNIGGSGSATAASLNSLINSNSATFASTSTVSTTVVTLTANAIGTAGNAITLSRVGSFTVSGATYTGGVNGYSVGIAGKIGFNVAPVAGHTLTWTGNFLFLCQFDKDELDPMQEVSGLWSSGALDFRSVKP